MWLPLDYKQLLGGWTGASNLRGSYLSQLWHNSDVAVFLVSKRKRLRHCVCEQFSASHMFGIHRLLPFCSIHRLLWYWDEAGSRRGLWTREKVGCLVGFFSHVSLARKSLFCFILEMSITPEPRYLINSLQVNVDQISLQVLVSHPRTPGTHGVPAGVWEPAVQSSELFPGRISPECCSPLNSLRFLPPQMHSWLMVPGLFGYHNFLRKYLKWLWGLTWNCQSLYFLISLNSYRYESYLNTKM